MRWFLGQKKFYGRQLFKLLLLFLLVISPASYEFVRINRTTFSHVDQFIFIAALLSGFAVPCPRGSRLFASQTWGNCYLRPLHCNCRTMPFSGVSTSKHVYSLIRSRKREFWSLFYFALIFYCSQTLAEIISHKHKRTRSRFHVAA